MAYTKSDLDSIRNKIDMLTYLEARGVTFRQTGASWVGLCPVHSERSPSFHVKPANQTYHCFGCGISGDIFSLVQDMEGLSFPGAVQMLAEETGIELKVDEDPNYKRRQRLYQITRLTSEWFRYNYSNIPMDHPAKANLDERNLLEYSLSDDSIGFAPNGGLIEILTKKGFSLKELEDAGVIKFPEIGNDRTPRERFRNRLVWTIYDVQGRPVGFSARRIFENDNGPKYLNSPQTELYNKSKVLLGLSDAKKVITQQQEVYVVEGNADVTAMKAAGILNTVATCGTAFGIEHANMLLHLSKLGREADKFKIVFCFDGDAAGVKAAKKVFETNKEIQRNSYVIKLDTGDGVTKDPSDYRKKYGDAKLAEAVSSAQQVSLVEFVLSEARKEWDISTPEGQSGFVNKAKEILSFVSDPIQHSSYLRKVAYWTGISLAQLTNMVKQRNTQPQAAPTVNTDVNIPVSSEEDPFENKILAAFIQYPQESLDLMVKYRMGANFFPNKSKLALSIVDQIEGDGLDYSNSEITVLSHLPLMIVPGREQFGLETLFKAYLKHLYNKELNTLNSRFAADSEADPFGETNAFQELLEGQQKLKEKYSLL